MGGITYHPRGKTALNGLKSRNLYARFTRVHTHAHAHARYSITYTITLYNYTVLNQCR